jgi:hypothetical protein
LVDVFDNVFVIFPQCDDGFSRDCSFLSCGEGCALILELVVCSLEAIINLKSDKSHDQMRERDH